MSSRCKGTKDSGERCERLVGGDAEFCFAHDPAHAERRKQIAARAGRSTSNLEIRAIKATLEQALEDVLEGSLDPRRASAANQLINTSLRAISLEREIREADEIERRLALLEGESAANG